MDFERWIPGAARGDLAAGVVVGIVALPLSLALAVAVGMPPVAGLYTAAFAGFAASAFGSSRFNITGPTAALVPLLSQVVFAHGPDALPLVGVLAGFVLLLMSWLRLGRLMRFMPGLVVTGFTAGIALSIAFGQLNPFLSVRGTNPALEHFHERAWDTLTHLSTVTPTTPLLGSATLTLLVLWPRLGRLSRVPGPLVAIVGATLAAWLLHLDTPTLAQRYGELPSGLPTPTLAFLDLTLVIALMPAAISIAVLGAVESLLSAVVADGLAAASRLEGHDPDRELFGQGIANLVSPVLGGMPATAAIARTATGIRNGAASRLTGMVHALTVLAATVALGHWAGHIPLTALAAVLLVVAWNIAEIPEVLRLLQRAPREDLTVLLSTIFITLFFDLTYAIACGVALSSLLLLRQLARVPAAAALLPDETGTITQLPPEVSGMLRDHPSVTVFTVQGMLSFHSAAAFEYELGGAACETLILRMQDVRHIDTTGLLTLDGVIEHRARRGHRTMISDVQPELRGTLLRFGILDHLGPGNVLDSTAEAVRAATATRSAVLEPARA